MLPLRFPRVWVTLAWLFVSLAIVACLLPGNAANVGFLNDKFMHSLGFFALTTWFTGIYPRSRYFLIAVLLLVMGIGIELAQEAMQLGRRAELRDVYADAGGIAAGVAIALAAVGGWAMRLEQWLARR